MFWEIAIAVEVISTIIKAVTEIAKSLGLIENKEDIDQLGDKALQAEEEGITPDEFDSFDEYMKAINEFKLDPEKSAELSEEQKKGKGLDLLLKGMNEKLMISTEGIVHEIEQNPEFFDGQRVKEYIDTFSKYDVDLDQLTAYLDKSLSREESKEIYAIIEEAEKKLNPDQSELEIQDMIYELKR